jgi:hypothetical protein
MTSLFKKRRLDPKRILSFDIFRLYFTLGQNAGNPPSSLFVPKSLIGVALYSGHWSINV